ncbi:hypothetical protein MRX96_040797 [Rhipicephalus microplus]
MRETSKTPGKRCGDRTSVTPLPKYTRDKASGSYGSTKCERGLAKVTDYVVSTDTWKGRLDFDRPSTAVVPGKREALARVLAKHDSYGHVQLSWRNPYVNNLCSTLISSKTCPENVRLDNIRNLSKGGLGQLFDVIALSKCVRTFRAAWEENV